MLNCSSRIVAKDPAEKLARRRLSTLEFAARLGNIAEACRRRGMDRTSFYEWKRRFQLYGLDGLKDLPPVHKTHPQKLPASLVEELVRLSDENPAWGCKRLSLEMKRRGLEISDRVAQDYLRKHGRGTRYGRFLEVELKALSGDVELTEAQVKLIEKMNPCFKERHVESSGPGELVCQDTFYVGQLKGVGRVYLHCAVDTFGSFAFARLAATKRPEAPAELFYSFVKPFYEERGLSVQAVLTDNGTEFCGTENHPFELILALSDVEHRRTRVQRPQTNGFVERFNRTVLDEFFRKAFRSKAYGSLEELQTDLDDWLEYYNCQRPHQGYRNLGRTPMETISGAK